MDGIDPGFLGSITGRDIVVGLAIALIIEGLLWAISPDTMRDFLRDMIEMPSEVIRASAFTVALVGVAILWIVHALS